MHRVAKRTLSLAFLALLAVGIWSQGKWAWIGLGVGVVGGLLWVVLILWRDQRERRFANPS
jgi:hypothetical protein